MRPSPFALARRSPAAVALAAAALAGACGAGEQGGGPAPAADAATTTPAPRPAAAPPALCGRLKVSELGRVAAPQATELSGLAVSPDQPGVLWTHNDSGDRARVLAVRTDGTLVADLDVPGAEAVDWEDLAIGPDPAGRGRALYLADIGDNAGVRDTIDVYRVPEPQAAAAATGATAPATRLRLRYPDGPHDAETLLVDPRSGALAVVTKQFSGESGVYVARAPAPEDITPLRSAGRLQLGLGGLATAGDVSADGRVIAVRTYTGFVVWARRPGASLEATLRRAPCRGRTSFPAERQGEALALSAHGNALYTVPEGAGPTLRRYIAAGR